MPTAKAGKRSHSLYGTGQTFYTLWENKRKDYETYL